ncbi:MAG: hypothetical protein GY867_10810 [bacterium]|nr:hypothetical protein [bacterium]
MDSDTDDNTEVKGRGAETGESLDAKPGLDYATFLLHRNTLAESGSKQSASFDRHVLTLASGVLGGVIVFLEKIAPDPVTSSLILLYFSWGGLLASISCTLSSFQTSKAAHLKDIEIWDAIYLEKETEDLQEEVRKLKSRIRLLNRISLGAFVSGLIFLGVFAGYNVWVK